MSRKSSVLYKRKQPLFAFNYVDCCCCIDVLPPRGNKTTYSPDFISRAQFQGLILSTKNGIIVWTFLRILGTVSSRWVGIVISRNLPSSRPCPYITQGKVCLTLAVVGHESDIKQDGSLSFRKTINESVLKFCRTRNNGLPRSPEANTLAFKC